MARTRGEKKAAPGASPEGRRRAAAVLEVLAGGRTPQEAAAAVGVSTPRYYLLEARALEGLVAACEPKGRGPGRSPRKELETLRSECDKLKRACARWQALARASQKAAGLAAPPTMKEKEKAKKGKGRRKKRRAAVRALVTVRRLRDDDNAPDGAIDGEVGTENPQGAAG